MSIFKKYSDNNFREIKAGDSEKKGIFLFWELFTRKFWNYIKLNLLYSLTSLPSLIIYWCVCTMYVVPTIVESFPKEFIEEMAVASNSTIEMFKGSVYFYFSCFGAIMLVALFGGGICSAGYNYVLRNYVRQENAYLFSDYFSKTKENLGQAFAVSIIDTVIVSICLFSISYYFKIMLEGGGTVYIFAFALLIFAFLLYAAMHTYIWTIMITFKVSLKQLFKNSLMLALGTASRTVVYMLCVALFAGVTLTIFSYSPMVVGILFLVILTALFNLAGHIFSYPIIKKYMIENNNKNSEGNDEE